MSPGKGEFETAPNLRLLVSALEEAGLPSQKAEWILWNEHEHIANRPATRELVGIDADALLPILLRFACSQPEANWLTMDEARWAELSMLASLEMRDALAEARAQRAAVDGLRGFLEEAGEKWASVNAEVDRLKREAVIWKSSLECWGRHHPWCWMVTQAGVEGVYCNCGYREALMGKDRSHEVTPLSPHDAEQVRLFEERIRASITPETQEAARRFIEARDAFAASGDSLPTPAPEATNDG